MMLLYYLFFDEPESVEYCYIIDNNSSLKF